MPEDGEQEENGRDEDEDSSSTAGVGPITLRLGITTSEDLLCELGPPVRTFWKEDDRMMIHRSTSDQRGSVDPALERESSGTQARPSRSGQSEGSVAGADSVINYWTLPTFFSKFSLAVQPTPTSPRTRTSGSRSCSTPPATS